MGAHRKSPAVTPARVIAVSAAVGTSLTVIQQTMPDLLGDAPTVPMPAVGVAPMAHPSTMLVAPDPAALGAPATYQVVSGDTLSQIAFAHSQSTDTLFGLNRDKVSDPGMIRVGQVLTLASVLAPGPVLKSSRHEDTSSSSDKHADDDPPTAAGVSSIPAIAKTFLGIKYVYGGKSRSGLDCSGLVFRVLKQAGITDDYRTSGELRDWTKSVSKSDARAGDLVFGPGHVAIYLGHGMMIDAPHTGSDVGIRKVYPNMTHYGRIPT